MSVVAQGVESRDTEYLHTEVSLQVNLAKGIFQSTMFLASALKRGCHLPQKTLKFNVAGGGGECL